MSWARSTPFRAVVVAGLLILLLGNLAEGDWAWVGIFAAVVALNLWTWRRQRSIERDAAGVSGPAADRLLPAAIEVTLADLLDRPRVRDAWAVGPAMWQQGGPVGGGLPEEDLHLSSAEVAEYVWITVVDEDDETPTWSVGVGDELKPLMDLDLDVHEDRLVAVLGSHPAVAAVDHSDREQYEVTVRGRMSLDDIAVLVARGLIAHHLDMLRRDDAERP